MRTVVLPGVALLACACSSVPFESAPDVPITWTEILHQVDLPDPPPGESSSCYPLRAWAGPVDLDESDFERPFGISVAGGPCNTTGYLLTVRRLASDDGVLQVHADLHAPGIASPAISPARSAVVLTDDHDWDGIRLQVRHTGR